MEVQMMAEPYKHIIVLHVGILLGAFLALLLGQPIGILIIIVIGKLIIDLREVRREEEESFLAKLRGTGKKQDSDNKPEGPGDAGVGPL